MLKSVDFLADNLEENIEILQKDSPQQNPLNQMLLSLALSKHASLHGANYRPFNAGYHSKSTEAKY